MYEFPGYLPTRPSHMFLDEHNSDSANLAPAVLIMCVTTIAGMTLYFPFRLSVAIQKCLPSVDPYTELGRRRTSTEMELEYQRRLDRDTNPFSYLYNDYRRQWSTYKSIYLFVKLAALLIVALEDPSNCLMRSVRPQTALLIRQVTLILAMAGFWILQSFLAPFLDPISNASEWDLGPDFAVIHWSWVQRIVKRIARRIDFSKSCDLRLDITHVAQRNIVKASISFSPRLDISPSSPHIKRRIWQETITTMILTHPDTRIPASQKMIFLEAPESEWSPYLLGYQGSPAERHVENIKILRELGGVAYKIASAQDSDVRIRAAFEYITDRLVGPDAYWAGLDHERKIDSRWGNAWCLPFPLTVVIRFDDGSLAVLSNLPQFEDFIHQNLEQQVVSSRKIRYALRCLESQVVFWPYSHNEAIGSQSLISCGGGRYKAVATTHFELGTFIIQRRGKLLFDDYIDLGSGFEIRIKYSSKVTVDGSVIGLSTEFVLTPMLATFFALNEHLIRSNLQRLSGALRRYREHVRLDAMSKRDALSYLFLSEIYEVPASPQDLLGRVKALERDITGTVAEMLQDGLQQGALTGVDERMKYVARSSVTAWWYLFWVQLMLPLSGMTSGDEITPLLPRYEPVKVTSTLAILTVHCLSTSASRGPRCIPRSKGLAYASRILNKVYFRLNQIVFPQETAQGIRTYVGGKLAGDVDLADIDHDRAMRLSRRHERLSTIDTGGGTDHDDTEIRERPAIHV
ncbi:hypothetical protein BS47DRAFT_1395777 [Hydnum rufescens UP504]|uniref:Uncharacterized protein n=1 Tax=Hydnum rufescens UP504 TaxID=1448309 RepID=A0A9P6ARP8_9AGAM|nr:hypothetical protein BS47DRAFT_1395777 [Hydnum rufescens UP504]